VVEHAMIVAAGPRLPIAPPAPRSRSQPKSARLTDLEAWHVRNVLISTGWRVRGPGGAAEILGLKPTTLEHRLVKLRIRRPANWAAATAGCAAGACGRPRRGAHGRPWPSPPPWRSADAWRLRQPQERRRRRSRGARDVRRRLQARAEPGPDRRAAGTSPAIRRWNAPFQSFGQGRRTRPPGEPDGASVQDAH
jgi:hypothetical protein